MTAREERAAGRQARRRQSKPTEQPTDAREAAREAATRALAAATVSAVRALASRATDETPEPDSPEPETVSPEAKQFPSPDPAEREVRPQKEKPRKGADTGRVQDVIRAARNHLRELHQTDPESVSGLERTANGWTVDLEVVEVRRIPESTDVLATYRVELDDRLDLLSYERARRYHRAQADDGGRS